MLLIFPSIEIRRGECVQLVQGEPGSERIYSIDPVQMAVLWRGENAKTLHVVDVDGVKSGTVVNRDTIQKIVQAIDIPVQVGGGIRDFESIQSLFQAGVYRVVLGTAAFHNRDLVERLIREFGARKIAIAIFARDGKIRTEGGAREHDVAPLTFALQMKQLGVSRFVYSEIGDDGVTKVLNTDSLKELAIRTGIRVTAQGGVMGYRDLIRLQELEKYGVDSVIIGKALYENRFPCQGLWRLNERELTDLGPTRRT
jgi:phosphoribosylformimino-5-aminoimidazole carboxamide ribotide isomerase